MTKVVLFIYFFSPAVLQNGYGSEDMAALGASLGALVFVCLVVIAVLIFQIRKENKDWKKIYESNIFRGSVSLKKGSWTFSSVADAFLSNFVILIDF